ncbi:tellurium resistance protein TerC [Rhizobium sp. KVB221]|uniref:Tellurium resistance protein TerC n=1 Tax=Rhizobium setariae TaxID=2801340 RepID=A0A936YPP0_9HYPH|nr:tellurium resistance protein TerC [Rhizobium setariae]MBL0374504.1 tellurium resistance protein TerC [Rhizobium setariae]
MFENLFTIDSLITFLILTALETVLGFDNLLYISIESKKVDPAREAWVRRTGILLAIGLRVVLLFVVLQLIAMFQEPIFETHSMIFNASVSGHSLIVLFGGIFLIYTAIKEIYHMIGTPHFEHGAENAPRRSVAVALTWILIMNIVFSFDTVLSAVALTKNFIVMTAAILISGALMVLLADKVSDFLKKNRMYEVLGLFVLLLVGFMLLSEGGHLAHLSFFGFAVEPLAKSTFYFILGTLLIVEIIQSRYQKRILAEQEREKH